MISSIVIALLSAALVVTNVPWIVGRELLMKVAVFMELFYGFFIFTIFCRIMWEKWRKYRKRVKEVKEHVARLRRKKELEIMWGEILSGEKY